MEYRREHPSCNEQEGWGNLPLEDIKKGDHLSCFGGIITYHELLDSYSYECVYIHSCNKLYMFDMGEFELMRRFDHSEEYVDKLGVADNMVVWKKDGKIKTCTLFGEEETHLEGTDFEIVKDKLILK